MNNGATIWLVVFGISATGFFIIALIVSVKGISDLRDLLRHSEQSGQQGDFSVQESVQEEEKLSE